ncbi:putative NADH-flavin reductase [Amycolatopsis bartoniae]|uniref:NAD(P)-dependent oxidoreductase n=1 Tax=Amycolatopsis bartoniae TaxID=941986 RepID=UPI001193185C|nr:NAD(P)-binding oxidoreductase [Amycolatopsis bartoniae]MBB2933498.1 putative NADH-flavin reductase [Amycolatopsis bartoniae]TVT07641.1 SDR family oxidoreductase [Amycolatopsis bartoniae]
MTWENPAAQHTGPAAGAQLTDLTQHHAPIHPRLDLPAPERLDVVTADVFDPAAIADAIRGSDVVLTALGPRDRGPSRVCRDGAASIIAAMNEAGVRRLLAVSNSGMHTEGDGLFTRLVVKPILIRVLREGFADMLEMERRITASSLDWTIVRPPRLTRGPHTGRIAHSVGRNVRGRFTISRADLADYLLRLAENGQHNRQAVSVAKG